MFNFKPKEEKFFTYFIDYTVIAYEAAVLLDKFLGGLERSEEILKEIKAVESKGDKHTHIIMEELNKTFITPLDREDIFLIAKQLDDVVDMIEECANRFLMYNVNQVMDDAKKMGTLIVNATHQLRSLMKHLNENKVSKNLLETIIEINRIEEEGDVLFRNAVRKLFIEEENVLNVIKWREIYEYLEKTLDACEEVANSVEGVVMKHA